jgi:hypothetical protein
MEVILQKLPNGALAPVNEEEAEKTKKLKPAAWLRCEVKQMRNAKFFRKWWVLAKYAYDVWQETIPTMEYRGQRVQPNFERFRKDLTIMAGYYEPIFDIKGELRVVAKSLAWASMLEDEFEKLYSATINAVLTKVLANPALNEEQLRTYVDQVLEFDR